MGTITRWNLPTILAELEAKIAGRPQGQITGAVTAERDSYYQINLAASLGNVAIMLPQQPPEATRVSFVRLDNNAFTSFANITAASGDTINGGSPWLFNNAGSSGGFVTFQYVAADMTWFVYSVGYGSMNGLLPPTSSFSFNPSMMSRDSSGNTGVLSLSFGSRTSAPGTPTTSTIYCADGVSWDPLTRAAGKPYLVFWNGAAWKAVSAA